LPPFGTRPVGVTGLEIRGEGERDLKREEVPTRTSRHLLAPPACSTPNLIITPEAARIFKEGYVPPALKSLLETGLLRL
jgi:hypothetical protein